MAEQEALIPPESLYALRCDLYDAADIPASVFDKVYVVCALGPIERHSPRCSVDDGVVCFESAEPGLENYYEQVEDIKVKMPDGVNREQHYDVFLHVYVATAAAPQPKTLAVSTDLRSLTLTVTSGDSHMPLAPARSSGLPEGLMKKASGV